METLTHILTVLQGILTVVVGLGLVIFVHELGHFAVAKWCNVNVERFSIGFGPVLWCRKWGETEYALSAIPFGGYVKMLGQDDMDPSQLSSEEIAEDPRSYTSKSVPQRMAIISAGVTMNVLTGILFFMAAFGGGIKNFDRVIGSVQVGMPAWTVGIRAGDTITGMNGESIKSYGDLVRGTALSGGRLTLQGFHADGERFNIELNPEKRPQDATPKIGVLQSADLAVAEFKDADPSKVVYSGTPAAALESPFQPGDRILSVDGTQVERYIDLEQILHERRAQDVTFQVRRGGETAPVDITVPPQPFVSLGIRLPMGKITAVRQSSPAASAGLQVGDRITHVDDREVGSDLDPLWLSDYFSERTGEAVRISVRREVEGGEPATMSFTLTPADRHAWSEPAMFPDSPLSIPSLGLAYQLIPRVDAVAEGSPAAQQGIQVGDKLAVVEFAPDPAETSENPPEEGDRKLQIGENGWPYVMWSMQQQPDRAISLTVQSAGTDVVRSVSLTPEPVADRFMPGPRGLKMAPLIVTIQADSIGEAISMGWKQTTSSMTEIYLVIRGLFERSVSVKGLYGPIGIATIAYESAGGGLAQFAWFLGVISINLAVINFLPIPVLDGGHMVFLFWEGIARKRPNERVMAIATYCGLLFVLGLMMLVIYLDLNRTFS